MAFLRILPKLLSFSEFISECELPRAFLVIQGLIDDRAAIFHLQKGLPTAGFEDRPFHSGKPVRSLVEVHTALDLLARRKWESGPLRSGFAGDADKTILPGELLMHGKL